MKEVRDARNGTGRSHLLELYQLAAHGQPVGRENYRALLFIWRLLGEPLSVWHGLQNLLSGLREE